MATFTTSWTNATLHSSSSVSNGANVTDDVNIASSGYYRIVAQIDLDIASGSPAGDVTIEVFGSSDSGTAVDTIPSQKVTVPFSGTGNKKVSLVIDGPWCRVKVSNGTGVSVTYVGKYSGLKQASA